MTPKFSTDSITSPPPLTSKNWPLSNIFPQLFNPKTKLTPPTLVMYLAAKKQKDNTRFWAEGELHLIALNQVTKETKLVGKLIVPKSETTWMNQRILAGNLYVDNQNNFYIFAGASSGGKELLKEHLLYTQGKWDGEQLQIESIQPLVIKDLAKFCLPSTHPEHPQLNHHQLRDPCLVKSQKGTFMFTSSSAKSDSHYKGCILISELNPYTGRYMAKDLIFPHFQENGEGFMYECERPQVFPKGGRWHVIFSVRRCHLHPRYLQSLEDKGIEVTDYCLYHYIAKEIEGPYHPAKAPVVKGSPQSNLYGINFAKLPDGKMFAYGLDESTGKLEIMGNWLVNWQGETPKISKISQNSQSLPQFAPEGYRVWDAMFLRSL